MANGLRDRNRRRSPSIFDENQPEDVRREQLFDPRTPPQDFPVERDFGPVSRGIEQGIEETRGSVLGARAIGAQLTGNEEHSETLQEEAGQAFESAQRVGPRVQDLASIGSTEDLANFILGGFGRVLPSAAGAAATGGIGGAVGSFAGKTLAKRAVSESVKRSLRRRARDAGATAGLTASSLPQESGAIFAEIDEDADTELTRGQQALLALGGGSLAAALDVAPQMRIFKRTASPKQFRKIRQGIVREVGKQAGFEGVTEASQELIQKATNAYIDKNVDVFDENTLNELGTAGALGVIGGGTLGGVSGAAARFLEDSDVEIPGFNKTRLSGDDVIRGAGKTGRGLGRAAAKIQEEIRKADNVVRAFTGQDVFRRVSPRERIEDHPDFDPEYVPGEDREEEATSVAPRGRIEDHPEFDPDYVPGEDRAEEGQQDQQEESDVQLIRSLSKEDFLLAQDVATQRDQQGDELETNSEPDEDFIESFLSEGRTEEEARRVWKASNSMLEDAIVQDRFEENQGADLNDPEELKTVRENLSSESPRIRRRVLELLSDGEIDQSLDIDIDAMLENTDLVEMFRENSDFREAVLELNPNLNPDTPNFNAILKDTVQRAATRGAELRAQQRAAAEQEGQVQETEEPTDDGEQAQTFETGMKEEGVPSNTKLRGIKGSRPEFPSPAQVPQEGRESTSFRNSISEGEQLVPFDKAVDNAINIEPANRSSSERALVGDEEARTPRQRQAIKEQVADRLLADLKRRGVKNLAQMTQLRQRDTNSFLAQFEMAQSEGPTILPGDTELSAAQIQDIKQRGREGNPKGRFAPVFGVKGKSRIRLDPVTVVTSAIDANPSLRSIKNRTNRTAKAFAEGIGALINQGEIDTFEEPADSVVVSPRNPDKPRDANNRDITYGEIKARTEIQRLRAALRATIGDIRREEKNPEKAKEQIEKAKETATRRAKTIIERERKNLGKRNEFIGLKEDELVGSGLKKEFMARLKELNELEKNDPGQFVKIHGEEYRLALERILFSTELKKAEIELERLELRARPEDEARRAELRRILDPAPERKERIIYDSAFEEREAELGDVLMGENAYAVNKNGDQFNNILKTIDRLYERIEKEKAKVEGKRTKRQNTIITGLEARIEGLRQGLDALASQSLVLSTQQRMRGIPAPFFGERKASPHFDIEEQLSEQLAAQRKKVRDAKKAKDAEALEEAQNDLIALQRQANDLVDGGDLHFPDRIGDFEERDYTNFKPFIPKDQRELRKKIIELKNKLKGLKKADTPELNPLRRQLDQYLKEERRARAMSHQALDKNTARIFYQRVEFLNGLIRDIKDSLGKIRRGEVQATTPEIFDLLLSSETELKALNTILDKNGRRLRDVATGLGRNTEPSGNLDYSLDADNTRSMTREAWEAAKKKVNEYLEKTVGKKALFGSEEERGDSGGASDRTTGAIYVSYYATDPLSTAFHESMHYALNNFLTPSQKEDLTAFFGKKKNLNRLITAIKNSNVISEKNKEKIIEVISEDSRRGIEERSTYGYQLWMAGEFNPAPATNNIFTFIKNMLRDILGILAKSERADLIFKALRDGALLRSANDNRPWVYPGTTDTNIKRGMRMVEQLTDQHMRPFMQGFTMPVSWWARSHSNPVVRKIIGTLVHSPLSPKDQATYMEVKNLRARKFAQKWFVGTGWTDLSKQQRNSVRDHVYARTPLDQIEDSDVRDYIGELRSFLNEMHRYMADAGLEIGYVDSFFPRVWDPVQMYENKEAFMTMMNKYKKELEAVNLTPEEAFDAIVRADGAEMSIPDILTSFAEKKFTKEGLPPELAKELQDKSVSEVNREIKRLSELEDRLAKEGNDQERIKVSQKKQAYELWANNVLGTFVHAPGSMSTKKRVFKFLDNEDLSPFLEQNFEAVMSKYIQSVVKRAEFARRFGTDGQKLREQVAEARTLGLSPKDEELLDNAIAAVRGTLGTNMNPRFRKISSWLITYQNFRLLALSAFTATADVSGILMRSQDAGFFWNSIKTGSKMVAESLFPREEIKKIKKRIKALDNKESLTKDEKRELVALKKQRRELKSSMRQVAEELGVIDSNVMHESLNNRFGHEFLYSKSETANNMFFTYTGLEYVTQLTRVMGTSAAISFIKSHTSRALDGNKRSKEFLAELNLDTSDVVLDEDGEIIFSRAALQAKGLSETRAAEIQSKMELAVNRFVDQSVPRPNAGDRPARLSDPHFMIILHLKQFIFTFQTQMLNRVGKQAVQGNYKPALYLMSFIPVIMAVDALRHTVQYWWDEPDWDDDWTAQDHLFYAAQRGGLLGMSEFAVDVNRNLGTRRGTGVEALGGPTVEQSMDLIRSMLTGNPGNMQTFTEALPAQNFYKNWPIFQDGEE